jgi:hypothetical protein
MARKSNSEVNYTSLLKPGVIPPIIGQFLFNTRDTQAFDVGHLIPNTVQEISVCLYMRSGNESENGVFNIWLWTELDNGRKDIKFKRSHRYPQNAISTDSETFNFAYSPNHPRLYLMSDCVKGQNILLELFVVGYAQ